MVRAVMVFGVLLAAPGIGWAQQQCTSNANQVVTRLYQQILERAPDANAAGRVQQLANGNTTVRQMVADLAKSPEHAQRFFQPTETQEQRESAVNFAYRHLLGRPGDAGGLRAYVTKAQQLGFNAVVDELVASAEYSEKFGNDGVPGTGLRWCGTATNTTAATAGSAPAQMRFNGMDRNGDGQIARNEWRGSARSFEVHDWDGDGVLAGDEVRVGGRRAATRWQEREFDVNTWTAEDFTDLDRNRDGRVTSAEWYFDAQSFRRADRNRDGILTRAEYLGNADTIADDDRDDRFEFLDDNGNGRIERAEWHGSADAWEWLDRNNDNFLTRAEVVGNEQSVPDGFANIDEDRDGRIELAEWRWSRRSFTDRDANGDGMITRQEFRGAVGTSGR